MFRRMRQWDITGANPAFLHHLDYSPQWLLYLQDLHIKYMNAKYHKNTETNIISGHSVFRKISKLCRSRDLDISKNAFYVTFMYPDNDQKIELSMM